MVSVACTFTCFVVAVYFLYVVLKNLSLLFKRNASIMYSTENDDANIKPNYVSPSRLSVSRLGEDDISWETRRDMGRHESYLAELDITQGTNIYAVISLKSRVSLRRELVQNALVLLARKHPLLRTVVESHARSATRCHETSSDISDCVELGKKQFVVLRDRYFLPELRFVNTSHWEIVLDGELSMYKADTASSCHGHLWRAILLRENYHANLGAYKNTLLFFFDQVIMDRMSLIEFIKDFQSFLCKLINCDIHISDTRPLKLQDHAENLLKKPSFLKILLQFCKEKWFSYSSTIPQWKSSLKKRRPCFLTKCLTEEETIELLNYTRREKITLASLFVSAWTMSGRRESVNNVDSSKPVNGDKVNVAVDFRQSLITPLPQSSLGNYSSTISVHFPTDKQARKTTSQFWGNVKQFDKQLNLALQDGKHLEHLFSSKHVDKSNHDNADFQQSTFEIADVKHFDLVQSHPFWLEDVFIGATGTTDVSLTLILLNNRLYCGMHVLNSKADSMHNHLLNELLTMVLEFLRTTA